MTKPQRRRPGAVSPLAAHVEPVRTPRSDPSPPALAEGEEAGEREGAPVVEATIAPAEQVNTAAQAEPKTRARRQPRVPSAGPAGLVEPVLVPRSEPKVAVTVMVRAELKARAETAVLATAGRPGGHRSWAALVNEAVARELVRLAEEFNDGVPFQANEGSFRTGAPFRS